MMAIFGVAAGVCLFCFWASMAAAGDHVGKLYAASLILAALAYGLQVMA